MYNVPKYIPFRECEGMQLYHGIIVRMQAKPRKRPFYLFVPVRGQANWKSTTTLSGLSFDSGDKSERLTPNTKSGHNNQCNRQTRPKSINPHTDVERK